MAGSLSAETLSEQLSAKQKDSLSKTVGNNVARKYGIVFKMAPDVAEAMRKFAKTDERNGDESDELPLTAAYVIAPDGNITYAFLDADYRLRAEPSRLVDEVKAQTSKPSAPGQEVLFFWGLYQRKVALTRFETWK